MTSMLLVTLTHSLERDSKVNWHWSLSQEAPLKSHRPVCLRDLANEFLHQAQEGI